MSGLREAVTGSDACAPNGAGPSNPLAGMADTLLGTSSKTRSRLHEYARLGAPTAAPAPPRPPATHAAALDRLLGPAPQTQQIPAVPSSRLHATAPGAVDSLTNTFEQAFRDAQAPSARAQPAHRLPPQPFQPAQWHEPHAQHPHAAAAAAPQLQASLHAFMHTPAHAPVRAAFAGSGAPAAAQLPLQEQVRIRDRSTILARHLFAERGDAYADAQAGALLTQLGIAPQALPARIDAATGVADNDAWQQVWQQEQQRMAEPMAAEAQAQRATAQRADPAQLQGWLSDWQHPGAAAAHATPHGDGAAWAAEFAQAPQQHVAQQQPGDAWAGEFAQRNGANAATLAAAGDANSAAQHSRKLADVLARDPEGKFKGSQFLQFLSKMSQGQTDFAAPSTAAAAQGAAWADEFTGNSSAGAWATEFASSRALAGPAQDWAEEFSAAAAPDAQAGQAWVQEFNGAQAPGADAAQAWAQEYMQQQAEAEAFDAAWTDASAESAQPALGLADEYTFAANNPYDGDPRAMDKALAAFHRGSLIEACLALEAVVKAEPSNAQAWRLLGTAHAENDDDRRAIAALARALAADPNNPSVLLALGVSHTNELQKGQAVEYLMGWLTADQQRAALLQGMQLPDKSQALSHARAAFARAAEAAPVDTDVATGLGVLCHLSGDFAGAAAAFEAALRHNPNEYSLWNKLGATLANSSKSEEAKRAYARALECKPNYMRAWSNLGIAHSNLGQYDEAARHYAKALSLNPNATSAWSLLKNAALLMGSPELSEDVEARNLSGVTAKLGLPRQPGASEVNGDMAGRVPAPAPPPEMRTSAVGA